MAAPSSMQKSEPGSIKVPERGECAQNEQGLGCVTFVPFKRSWSLCSLLSVVNWGWEKGGFYPGSVDGVRTPKRWIAHLDWEKSESRDWRKRNFAIRKLEEERVQFATWTKDHYKVRVTQQGCIEWIPCKGGGYWGLASGQRKWGTIIKETPLFWLWVISQGSPMIIILKNGREMPLKYKWSLNQKHCRRTKVQVHSSPHLIFSG